MWDSLFATPGYAALEEREGKREILTAAFRFAFSPRLRPTIDSVMEAGGFLAYSVRHLLTLPGLRDSLRQYTEQMRHGREYEEALRRAQEFLPSGLTTEHEAPPVSLVFFAPDGRGYPSILVGDLRNIMLNPDPAGFFAHEMHHYFRNQVSVLSDDFDDDDFYTMYVFINTEEEGIADQLDKDAALRATEEELGRMYPDAGRRDFYSRYRVAVDAAPAELSRVDSTLSAIASGHAAEDASRQLHGSLAIGGRPLGAFMAKTIIDHFSTDRLAATVGDPFAFWRLHDEAAAQDDRAPGLSDGTRALLDEFEARYSGG